MNVLAAVVTLVARLCDTCLALVDVRAAAERDLICPRCGRVRRLSDHPVRMMLEDSWFVASAEEQLRPDGCARCRWTSGEGPGHSGNRA